MKISLNKKILDRNEDWAMQNRHFFDRHGIFCVNVISSPGSGKTTVIAKTITDLSDKIRIGVIEGDIKTDTDARRIRSTGAPAVQIETEGACHLSAQQVASAVESLPYEKLDVIFIENVGNLVCPSAFALGEHKRIVVLSIPEGDDKPIKYPGTFAGADAVLINKIDLLEYLDFSLERATADIRVVNPNAKIFQLSAKTGQGMQQWLDWLIEHKKST